MTQGKRKDLKPVALVVYHANCTDGMMAGYITHKALSEQGYHVHTMAADYSTESNDLVWENAFLLLPDIMYIVDYSLPPSLMQEFARELPDTSFCTLDHHKTAFENYSPGEVLTEHTAVSLEVEVGCMVHLCMYKSGAGMVWDHFYPGLDMPSSVRFVQDRDLWIYKYGNLTRYFHQVLKEVPKNISDYKIVFDACEDSAKLDKMLEIGKEAYREYRAEVEDLAETGFGIKLDGKKGLAAVIKDGSYASDVGNELAKLSGTFGCTLILDEDTGMITHSIRSIAPYEVDRIAKVYGGGGHAQAAGFTRPMEYCDYLPEVLETVASW